MTVVVGAPEDFTLEAFRRVAVDGESVVIGPDAVRVMAEARARVAQTAGSSTGMPTLRLARWSRWNAKRSALPRSGMSWAAIRSRADSFGECRSISAGQIEHAIMASHVAGTLDHPG